MRIKGLFTASTLMGLFLCGTASAASTVLMGSGVLTSDSQVYSLTGLKAVNGNIDSEGFLGLMNYTYREFNYDSTLFGNTTNYRNVINSGSLLAGYQRFFKDTNLAVFLGLNYISDTNTPTDLSRENVNEYGLKVQLYVKHDFAQSAEFVFSGAYSTADQTYDVESHLLYGAFPSINIGPKVSFSGSNSYDERRYGLLLTTSLTHELNLGLGTGFSNNRLYGDVPYIELTLTQRV